MSIAVLCQRAQNLALHPDALQIQQLDRELRQAKATKRQQPLIEGAFKNLASARQKLASLEGRVEKGAPDSSKSSSISICERIKNLFSTAISYLRSIVRKIFYCVLPVKQVLGSDESQSAGRYEGSLSVDTAKESVLSGCLAHAACELWNEVKNRKNLSVEGYANRFIDRIVREGSKKLKETFEKNDFNNIFPISLIKHVKPIEVSVEKTLEKLGEFTEIARNQDSKMLAALVLSENLGATLLVDVRNEKAISYYYFDAMSKPAAIEVFTDASKCADLLHKKFPEEACRINPFTVKGTL